MLGFNLKSIWLLAILAMSLCNYQNVSGEDCENDIMAFNIECMIFMNKDLPKPINPNDRCCNVIRRANVPCVCKNGLSKKLPYINGTYADIIGWNNVLYCFNYCHRPLTPGFKCDRFTVPGHPPSSYQVIKS
ncbi:hypothetical protein P8452_19342 [Trifolium repens]|nr:hypothetical protein P8452_19342 [Trifolium repens]